MYAECFYTHTLTQRWCFWATSLSVRDLHSASLIRQPDRAVLHVYKPISPSIKATKFFSARQSDTCQRMHYYQAKTLTFSPEGCIKPLTHDGLTNKQWSIFMADHLQHVQLKEKLMYWSQNSKIRIHSIFSLVVQYNMIKTDRWQIKAKPSIHKWSNVINADTSIQGVRGQMKIMWIVSYGLYSHQISTNGRLWSDLHHHQMRENILEEWCYLTKTLYVDLTLIFWHFTFIWETQ